MTKRLQDRKMRSTGHRAQGTGRKQPQDSRTARLKAQGTEHRAKTTARPQDEKHRAQSTGHRAKTTARPQDGRTARL